MKRLVLREEGVEKGGGGGEGGGEGGGGGGATTSGVRGTASLRVDAQKHNV